jgi:type I restriction enzyme S subunit
MLRISDIQDGRVDWSSVPYCDCPDPEPYSLSAGDILFARTGATTGKSFLIDECPPSVFASYLIRLRVRSLVTPEYLHSFFQSPSYWRQITAGSRGTGQPNCNGKTLAQVRVPVPPIAEQSRMMSVLDDFRTQVSKVSRVYDNAEAEFDALLPSVLDQAFKGEL